MDTSSLGSTYNPRFARSGAKSERIAAAIVRFNGVNDAKHSCTFESCPRVEKKSSRSRKLTREMWCEVCKKGFQSQFNLKRHNEAKHLQKTPELELKKKNRNEAHNRNRREKYETKPEYRKKILQVNQSWKKSLIVLSTAQQPSVSAPDSNKVDDSHEKDPASSIEVDEKSPAADGNKVCKRTYKKAIFQIETRAPTQQDIEAFFAPRTRR